MDLGRTTSPVGITGASGFIGGHLVGQLKKEKVKTRALLLSKKDESEADEIFYGDLAKDKGLDKFLSGVTTVINLVGSFNPPFQEQLATNVLTLNSLCEAAVANKIKKIIHISSSTVYGSLGRAFTEKASLLPDTSYGLAKKLAEELAVYYQKNYGISFVILRPTNVYGPGSDHGVVFEFSSSIKERGNVAIFGDGKQKRDFLYVADLVGAIIKAMKFAAKFEVFNVGSGKTNSLLELVSILEKILDRKISIDFKDGEKHVSRFVSADINKAKKLLKWQPKVMLKEGLGLTLREKIK